MVVKLKNRRIAPQGQFFRNAVSGVESWVPEGWKPKVWLALAHNVPQQFISLLDCQSFAVVVPDHDYFDMADELSCTICGDAPYPGQKLLDRDLEWDRRQTCQRCEPDYLCDLCRCEPSPGNFACLACLYPEEECRLGDNRRLAALQMFWALRGVACVDGVALAA